MTHTDDVVALLAYLRLPFTGERQCTAQYRHDVRMIQAARKQAADLIESQSASLAALREATSEYCNRYLKDEHADPELCWDAGHHRAICKMFAALENSQ